MDKLVKKLNGMIEECHKKDGVRYSRHDVSTILFRLLLDVMDADIFPITAKLIEIMTIAMYVMPSTTAQWTNRDMIQIYRTILDGMIGESMAKSKGLIFDE